MQCLLRRLAPAHRQSRGTLRLVRCVSRQDSSEDLVRSAMQKARRLSIRTKGRPSIVSQSVLPQAVSAIAEVDVIDTIEANNIWDLAVKMKQVGVHAQRGWQGRRWRRSYQGMIALRYYEAEFYTIPVSQHKSWESNIFQKKL